uniref:RHD domain-containing protein n=1 Tax=Daphnia galeata TaxID=27404 RepID=A0A8J2WKA3_9CRUS|nr:unnamed protein product [Daphnia galeata]
MMTSPLFDGEINSCYVPGKINSFNQWINETYPILVQPILQENPITGGHCVPYVPCLKILREPQPIFRFRYGSELQTERHGFLLARSVDPHNKDWMSVQLENWYGQGDVWIRYSLVTDTPERSQHFHRLGKKTPDNQMIASEYYQYNAMTRKENNYSWTAEFPGISILREKKSCVKQMIVDRQKANGILTCVNQEEIKMMWSMRDTVRIKFEAFSVVNGRLQDSICQPVYSEPIRHSKKSKKEDQLHIVKVCNAQGLCTGNEEICIFVKKLIKDDIGILFFQNVGQYQWRVEAEVTYVHHGLAIAFKTPAYYNQKIQESVTVQLVLFSKGLDYRVSKPKTFTYLPIIGAENPIPAKVDCDMVQQLPELRSSQYTQKSDSHGNVIPNAPADLNVLGQDIFDAGDVFEGLSFNDFHQIIDEYDDINSSKLLDEYTMILDDYYQTDAVKSNNTLEQTRQRNNKIESVRQSTQPIPADKKKSVGVNWQSYSRGSASADIPVVEGLDIIINRLLINDDEASENDSSDSDDTSSDDDTTDSESNSINNGSDYSSSDEN